MTFFSLQRARTPSFLAALLGSLLACSGSKGGDEASGSGGASGGSSGSGTSGNGTSGNGSSGGGSGPVTSAGELSYRPCADASHAGGFQVRHLRQEISPPEAQEVVGRIYDGVRPSDVWEELAAEGGCRVLIGPVHFCDPECSFEEDCTKAGTCAPRPTQQDVGTVQVRGLGADFELTASSMFYYQAGSVMLAMPPYQPGDEIELEASGGRYAPFLLRGRGVPLLVLAADELVVAEGQDLPLRWDALEQALPTGVHVEIDIAHHAGVSARIECDLEDTGSYDVPGALVSTLLEQGVAGFPLISVARRTVDSVAIDPGCVELVVSSEVLRPVTVPGVVSCNESDMPCPDGRVCNTANLTCLE